MRDIYSLPDLAGVWVRVMIDTFSPILDNAAVSSRSTEADTAESSIGTNGESDPETRRAYPQSLRIISSNLVHYLCAKDQINHHADEDLFSGSKATRTRRQTSRRTPCSDRIGRIVRPLSLFMSTTISSRGAISGYSGARYFHKNPGSGSRNLKPMAKSRSSRTLGFCRRACSSVAAIEPVSAMGAPA